MRCVTGLIKAFHDFTTKNLELPDWNQLHYNKELNKNKQNWIFVVFHDEFHQLVVENTGLLFSSCVDRWMMEHRRRPSVRLQLCRRHINTWLCMCALVHAAASCVNLDSYTCVVDYSTPCYGWLNHRGVDILSWPRWKVQRLRSFFFFVLLFLSEGKRLPCLYNHLYLLSFCGRELCFHAEGWCMVHLLICYSE